MDIDKKIDIDQIQRLAKNYYRSREWLLENLLGVIDQLKACRKENEKLKSEVDYLKSRLAKWKVY